MILLEIKNYIIQQQEVTLPQLAMHFQIPESAIENMAEIWVQKKMIEKLILTCGSFSNNSGCNGCSDHCQTQIIHQMGKNKQILYRPIPAYDL
ncbi:FeoC-like transcriptional regulator [Wohlfahrtiimonas larvae]|uniref:Transcriptional regulator HTH-type FeoC domain-containing protein n=1 Tax=Wohlfahrtiimonas larvae TaxID=1157986 RepID=A0ABP9MT96_9GAMM|nr:FeoC-like transcriptional regulator [Wohlfahrtiimonas larvae]